MSTSLPYQEYGPFRIGNVDYPLKKSPTKDTALKLANPFLNVLLDYIEEMLNIYMKDVFIEDCKLAGLSDITSVVEYKLPYDPTQSLISQQVEFPLLACWTSEGRTVERTFIWYSTVSTLNITYTLPPLTEAQKEILQPYLKAVLDIITAKIEQGQDPNFENCKRIYSDEFGGIEYIKNISFNFGNISRPGNLFLPTLHMKYEVGIRENINYCNFNTFDEAHISTNVNEFYVKLKKEEEDNDQDDSENNSSGDNNGNSEEEEI